MDVLRDMNDQQRRAVTAREGSTLIVAGPGTGKTKTLTGRIAFLLEGKHAKPEDIVALTFTNKASREMRERLQGLLEKNAVLPKVTTFHALGHELLRHAGGMQRLLREPERQEIIRSISRPQELKGLSARELGLIISRLKTSLQPRPDDAPVNLLKAYEAELQVRQAYDFDDLLTKTYEHLRVDRSRPQYKHALVDEFQDTSELQYELLKLLSTKEDIFVIGDPNQSIYAFRGAGVEMFKEFRSDFPNVEVVNLSINYRSRPEIVALANAIFSKGPQLTAHVQTPGMAQVVQTFNEYSEAAYVINTIEQGIGGSDMLKANGDQMVRQPRDYAVLYRTHRAAKTLQRAFAESGIPYQVAGEGSPYEYPEIQAIIAVMSYLQDPDEGALPVLKSFSLNQVKALLKRVSIPPNLSVSDLAARIAEVFGFDSNQNLHQFLNALVQFGTREAGLDAALEHINEISQSEFYDPSVNAVTLLTIHASKGLEFEHVFLCAAEEGILPKLSKKGEENFDEERRLFYVAVTRAKEVLEVLYAKTRSTTSAKLSRFVEETPEGIMPLTVDPEMQSIERKRKKRQQKRAQGSLF
jgi:superfamily I DNA/RNA helicase